MHGSLVEKYKRIKHGVRIFCAKHVLIKHDAWITVEKCMLTIHFARITMQKHVPTIRSVRIVWINMSQWSVSYRSQWRNVYGSSAQQNRWPQILKVRKQSVLFPFLLFLDLALSAPNCSFWATQRGHPPAPSPKPLVLLCNTCTTYSPKPLIILVRPAIKMK